jgi:hypothetical protein
MTAKRSGEGGENPPIPCPRCGQQASAHHFKTHKRCAAYVARLRAMLNVSHRKRVVAGPGRPRKKPKPPTDGGAA